MAARLRSVKISEDDICSALIKLKDPDGSTYHQIRSYLISCKDKLKDLPVKRLDAEIKKATKRGIERGMITHPKYGKRFRVSPSKLKSKGLLDKLRSLRECRCVAAKSKSTAKPVRKLRRRRCCSCPKSRGHSRRGRRRGRSRRGRSRRGRSRRGRCKSRSKKSPSSKSKRKPYCSRYIKKDCIRRRRCRKRRGTLRYCSKYRSYCCRRRKKRCKSRKK